MKYQSMAISMAFVAAGLALAVNAQDSFSSSTSSSASSTSGLAAPRTGIYPGAINAAADNTIDDYTKRGTLLGGKQYFAGWGGASLVNGAYAFNAIGFDMFGAITAPTAAGTGAWRTGIANSLWAAGILVNFNKTTTSSPAGKTKTVVQGDGFGLFGDFNLHGSDVYGEAAVITAPGNYTKTPVLETTPRTMRFMAGWKKDATTEGTHALNAEATLVMSSLETDPATAKTTETGVDVAFYHGYILKAATGYSVFLGSSTHLIYDATNLPAPTPDPDQMGISIAPNLVFHKTLGHDFELTSGASTTLSYFMASNPAVGVDDSKQLLTTNAAINLGLRWVKDNFAFEGTVNQALIQHGPDFISGGNAGFPMFGQIGMSLAI